MPEQYHLSIGKDYLVFSAAHFITYDGELCERLHGHNYRVQAEIHGPLDENHYVVDFIAVRDSLKEIVDELDHQMLLPTEHPLIQVVADQQGVEVTFRERRWLFPRGDCILLPIPNTTTELLARVIGNRLLRSIENRTGTRLRELKLAVDENYGQWGVWHYRAADSDGQAADSAGA
jgi:6-pyruvoyltetrahydropterin/6-carboxytetrahydropterin synthase